MHRDPPASPGPVDPQVDWSRLGLPDSRSPLPDEIAGSWLCRIMALNALLSPERLWEALGFDRPKAFRIDADPASGGTYVDPLSAVLGIQPGTFLRDLSTRPYWIALGAVNARTRQHGFVFLRGLTQFLRVCPMCLDEDMRTHGVGYIRRTHQLRSQACPHHGLVLQDACRDCKRAICARLLPSLVGPRCRCGATWAKALERKQAGEVWQGLATFSDAMLHGAPGELDPDALRVLAKCYAVAAEHLAAPASVEAVLDRAYGLRTSLAARSWLNVLRESPSAGSIGYGLGGHLSVAVLSACGVSYQRALVEIQRRLVSERTRRPSSGRKARQSWTVAISTSEAQQIAIDYLSAGRQPSELRYRLPSVYWLLLLKKRRWLDAWTRQGMGTLSSLPIPSVEEDRLLITSTKPLESRARHARARARIRDTAWMAAWVSRERNVCDGLSGLEAKLAAARKAHLEQAGRPVKWTIRVAAEKLHMNYLTLREMRHRPSSKLKAVVPEAPDEFRSRLIRWGIDECNRTSRPVTSRNVAILAAVGWQHGNAVLRQLVGRTDVP
ncbi:TniQ family protein [Rhizobacter sp. P5_C2]